MSTQETRGTNNTKYEENHNVIAAALKTAMSWAGTDWVTVSQLSKKTELKRETIYYHLSGHRRPGRFTSRKKQHKGFLLEGSVQEDVNKKCYCWLSCLKRTQAIQKVLEALYRVAELSAKTTNSPFDFKEDTFFTQNLFFIIPVRDDNGEINYEAATMKFEDFKEVPLIALDLLLSYIKEVEIGGNPEKVVQKLAMDIAENDSERWKPTTGTFSGSKIKTAGLVDKKNNFDNLDRS